MDDLGDKSLATAEGDEPEGRAGPRTVVLVAVAVSLMLCAVVLLHPETRAGIRAVFAPGPPADPTPSPDQDLLDAARRGLSEWTRDASAQEVTLSEEELASLRIDATPVVEYETRLPFDRTEMITSQLVERTQSPYRQVGVVTEDGSAVGQLTLLDQAAVGWEIVGMSWGGSDGPMIDEVAVERLELALGGSLDAHYLVVDDSGRWIIGRRGRQEAGVLFEWGDLGGSTKEVTYQVLGTVWTGSELRNWFEWSSQGSFPRGDMATIAPSVSDNRLVWVTLADGQWQLVLRDLRSRREETLTADPYYLANPVIDGDTVVWVDADDRTGIERIRLLDLATRKKRVLSEGSLRKSEPAVNGNRVAWVERSHSEEPIALLHLHDLDTGVTEIVAKNAWAPSISDRYLAWTERIQTGEENRETDVVRVRDLRSGRIRTFVAEEGDLWYPKVSGNLLVAFTHEPRGRGGSGIILIDLRSGERREVVWSEEEIWDARIDGRTIAWIQRSDVPERDPFTPHRFEADVVIFDVDSGAMMRIKRSGEQLRPEIRDGWLAWTDWAGGRMEIVAERVDRLGERL